MENFISQIIGFFAFVVFVISIQQRTKKQIIVLQVISFLLYSLQYFIIKAYSGMIIFIINMLRSIVFSREIKSKLVNKGILVAFILLSIGCGILTYEHIYDILPILASLLSVIFTWQPITKILRFGQITICALWIVYDIFVLAYIGILTETLIIISTIVSIINIEYEIDLFKYLFKYYIKIRFKANDEIINFSYSLPRIKLIKKKKIIK